MTQETILQAKLKELQEEVEQISQSLHTVNVALDELEQAIESGNSRNAACDARQRIKITMIENLQGETRKLCDTCLYQASRAITSNDLRTTYLNYHESATQLLEKLAGLLKLQNEVVKAVSYRSLQFEFRNLVSIEQVNNTLAKWRSMAELAKQCQSEEMLGAISLRLEILEQMLEKLQA